MAARVHGRLVAASLRQTCEVPYLNPWFESMACSGTCGGCHSQASQSVGGVQQRRSQSFLYLPHKMTPMNYWLMKSEPGEFSIDDLGARPRQTEPWDGVRNYQARNMMRDQMAPGDPVFFYHSNCEVPGIVGIMEVASEAYPDPTAFDPEDKHYDPKSDPDKPRWYLVDVRFVERFAETIPLAKLKMLPELDGMQLLKRGNRLSVMPIDKQHWDVIMALAGDH